MVWDMFATFDYFIHLEGKPASPYPPDHLFRKKMNCSRLIEVRPLITFKRLGYIFRGVSNVRFEKAEAFSFKPVKIFPAPVQFVFQAGFGIKINIAVMGIDDVFFLTRIQSKPAPGLPVFRLIFSCQITYGNVDGEAAIIFYENLMPSSS